jgi:hypothetical protein
VKKYLFYDILVGSMLAYGAIMAFLVLSLTFSPTASCQEVIMNQPSADIVDRGKLFVRSDSFYTQSPAFFEQNLNAAYGLFKNFEVSLNGVNVSHSQAVIVPGFKWALVKNQHFELYVGDQYWKPVSRNTYHNGNVTYEAVAFTFFDGRLRFTGGSFQSHNAYQLGNRAGAIGGIEYVMHKFRNGWAIGPGIDYASGAGLNGYTSPGLNFSKGSFFFCPGYMIANPHNPNGAHQSFVMVGYTF